MQTETKRTRSDYRNLPPGSWADYLLNEFPSPHRPDFLKGLRGEYKQLHDTSKDECGNWLGLDESGRPAIKDKLLDSFTGRTWFQVKDAIEEVRQMTGVPGADYITVLEWFQNYKINKARGDSVEALAIRLGCTPSTVVRWRGEAIDLVKSVAYSRNDD